MCIAQQPRFSLRPGNYDVEHSLVLYCESGIFPSFGFPRSQCSHPSIYHTYAEWEGPLGHGWFCALCGDLLQVG